MPHLINIPGRLSNTQSLLDAAKAAARDVAPYKDQFIAKGVPSDFLDQLNASIQTLENADKANVTARLAVANAKGQLTQSFQEGRDALVMMDSTVRQLCNANPAVGAAALAVWNTIVSPRTRAERTATNVVSGTTADVGSGSTAAGTTDTTTTAPAAEPATSGGGASATAS